MRTGLDNHTGPISGMLGIEAKLQAYLRDQSERAAAALQREALGDDERAFDSACGQARRLLQLRQSLACLTTAAETRSRIPTYLVGAEFLHDAARRLTRTQNEDLVYVTGLADGDGGFALTRLVRIALKRGVAHATPVPASAARALASLDAAGELFLAMFHSHAGDGAGATRPSKEDLNTQERLERAEYPTIGAIVSRDGHVRFYAVNRRFRVAISGDGYEEVGDSLFYTDGTRFKPQRGRRR